jgi:sulfur carrier protein ThiS
MISVAAMDDGDVENKLMVKVEFFPSKEKGTVELKMPATGIDLLKALDRHLDSHILTRNGTPIPIDEKLEDGDEIRILSVASGG